MQRFLLLVKCKKAHHHRRMYSKETIRINQVYHFARIVQSLDLCCSNHHCRFFNRNLTHSLLDRSSFQSRKQPLKQQISNPMNIVLLIIPSAQMRRDKLFAQVFPFVGFTAICLSKIECKFLGLCFVLYRNFNHNEQNSLGFYFVI